MTAIRDGGRLLVGVVLSVAAAVAVASATSTVLGGQQPLVPLAAAGVVAVAFARSVPVGLLSFGMFALFADTMSHWLRLELLLFDELGLLLLVAVAVATRSVRIERIRPGIPEIALLVLAVAAVASSLVAAVPAITAGAGLFLLLKGALFFELVRWLQIDARWLAPMGVVVGVVAALITCLAFVELLDPVAFQGALGLPVQEQSRAGAVVVRSIFLHPAMLGWITAYAALLLGAQVFGRRAWWAVLPAAVFLLGTWISGRRTPLIGVVIAVFVGLVAVGRRVGARRALARIWLPAIVGAAVLAIAVGPSLARLAATTAEEYGGSWHRATEILDEDPDASVVRGLHPRIALYVGSIAIARDEFPLGGGIGRFGSHLSRADYSPLYERYGLNSVALLTPDRPWAATDAYWPMVLGETGIIGFVAMATFLGAIAATLWRHTVDADSRRRTVAFAALFILVEAVVRSATSSVFVAPPIAYFVFGAAGAAIGTLSRTDPPVTSADPPT